MIRLLPFLIAALLLWTGDRAAAATVEKLELHSSTLDRSLSVNVLRPDALSDGPLPVVFLLHGYGGGASDWLGGGRAKATAEAVFSAEGAVPMLLVMPGVGNSWYVNSEKYGAVETALVEDIVPEIDRRYPTDARAERRFVVGLSMGGYGVLRLAVAYPEKFSAAAAFSPAIFDDVSRPEDFPGFQIKFFAGAFGSPFDVDRFNSRNIFRPLQDLTERAGGRKSAFYLMTGDHDGLGLWDGTLKFFYALRRARLPVELRVHDGNHEWRLWRNELEPALQWLQTRVRPTR